MQAPVWRSLILVLTTALPTVALPEDNPLLDEVIVTAPQVSDPLTVVTDPRSPRQPVPAHDGADYLKNIPGFSAVRKGGTDGDPVLRGLAGSRLNVLMDGQYILGGCGMRMDPPTAYVFPEAYDRITVLKGPQTVVYGGGNLAGTALFERRTSAFEEPGTRAFGGVLVGSFDRHDELLDVTGGAPAGFARVIGTNTSSNDYEDGAGNKVHSAYTRWSTSLIGGWTPDPDTRVELSVDRSDGEARYADRSMDGTLFDRTGYGMKFEKSGISPLLEKLEAQVYHNYVDHIMDNYSLRPKTAAMYMINNPDRTTQGARVAGKLFLATRTSLNVGIDYQKNEHTLRSASGMTVPDIDAIARKPDMTFASTGVFAETEHALDDQQRLIAGLRFDRLNVDNEKTTGSGALSSDTDRTKAAFVRYEQETAPQTYYVGLGHAERPADWWERSTYNNFFLEPEKSNQLDAGVIHTTEKWRASLSIFYANIDDFILTRNNNTARNIDATTHGAEADLAYVLGGSWKVTTTLAWTHGDNLTDDVPLAQMPPLEGRLGLAYDDKTWSFGVLARAVDNQDRVQVGYGSIVGQDIGPTPGFTVYSLNAGYRPKKGTLVSAGIDNLFDKTYAEHLSRSGAAVAGYTQTTRVNEPGRNLWLKASIALD
jgi:iron complex outermembrane receptor protein